MTECALDKYRAIAEASLPDLGDILRANPARSKSFAVATADVPCRVSPPRSFVQAKEGEAKPAQTVRSIVDMIAILPVGTDLRATDRFRANGVVFEVIGTDKGRSEAISLTAQLKRVK